MVYVMQLVQMRGGTVEYFCYATYTNEGWNSHITKLVQMRGGTVQYFVVQLVQLRGGTVQYSFVMQLVQMRQSWV